MSSYTRTHIERDVCVGSLSAFIGHGWHSVQGWTLTVPLHYIVRQCQQHQPRTSTSTRTRKQAKWSKVDKLTNSAAYASFNLSVGWNEWPNTDAPEAPSHPPTHSRATATAKATTTQLNTLQKNKLTADDDLSETGFYPFIHTHNVQRSLLRYNLPLSPAPSFSVSNVQTISKKGGGGEPSERMSCHRLTDIAWTFLTHPLYTWLLFPFALLLRLDSFWSSCSSSYVSSSYCSPAAHCYLRDNDFSVKWK